ncbi:MAG TPA: L-threonylcarbamoyladenylate synthase [Polyangiaceae bacterium]|jgi:tRNA threonylcarbamoyl adenosine modification protein (Sua5/YciO/YrdC/YwlC family)
MLIEINPENPEPRKIRRAVDALGSGAVIGYPTDTVYGLGCDVFNKRAVDRLYQIKGMDRNQMLAFLCRDLADVSRYAVMHDSVHRVLKAFLPGPYCFILEATREVPKIVQSPRKTVGIRVPDHPVALALTTELGRPIISTTAARHGSSPQPDPKEIAQEFPGLELVLDGGPGGTLPTSVVDLTGPRPRVIRAGAGDVAPFEE